MSHDIENDVSIYLPILPPVKNDHYRQAHVGRKEGRGEGAVRRRGIFSKGVQGWGIGERAEKKRGENRGY